MEGFDEREMTDMRAVILPDEILGWPPIHYFLPLIFILCFFFSHGLVLCISLFPTPAQVGRV